MKLLLAIFLIGFASPIRTLRPQVTVTNEDIRDAILQVVNVVRTTEDKLERHEYRERVLGDNLKKALVSVDKRIKLLDPFKGAIGRIDERLATVETILMQKEEQQQKTYNAIDDIQNNLPQVMEQLKNEIIEKLAKEIQALPTPSPDVVTKKDFEKLEKQMLTKLNSVASSVERMEKELEKIKEDNKKIQDMNNNSSQNLEKVKRQLDNSEQLLARYENKLAEYNNKIPVMQSANYNKEADWKEGFQQALEVQKSHVAQILSDVKQIYTKVSVLPTKKDLESSENATLASIAALKQTAPQPAGAQNVASGSIEAKINDLKNDNQQKHTEIVKSLEKISENAQSLSKNLGTNHDELTKEIQNIRNDDKVMMQTAESVLETKRRLEYGVHQILSEISLSIKGSVKDITMAINNRFDIFEMAVLDEENGALANITSKIREDIDQVWRQIGVMHQQMSATSDTLNQLQNQTDSYVNGSLDILGNMQTKVGKVTQRMNDVDENLNYLLGKLSLMNQEFNQIKTGLGNALDELRGNFKVVDDQITQDVGNGKKVLLSKNTRYDVRTQQDYNAN